jgi:hypothetical protein
MIPSSRVFDQSCIAAQLDHDPVVQEARAFFALLDWSLVEQWQTQRSSRGRPAHPESAYLKAFLLRIKEGFAYTTQLRAYLLKHPLLIIELGFTLVLDPSAAYGFDVQRTLPSRYWLSHKLRHLDRGLLTDLLSATVHMLQEQIPGLGEVISFDVKHLYAWVKENNQRLSIAYRYATDRRPVGDPDCRVGVKKSHNRQQEDGSTKVKKEYLWGYGSGVAAATTAEYGDVVLAELTQPFDQRDIPFFRPLYHQAAAALSGFPTHLAADAAFDAWYVYEHAVRHGGIAAVPLNAHSCHTLRDPDGVPRCEKGLRMTPRFFYHHTYGYRAQRFGCPLLFPTPTGATCPKLDSTHGRGCQKDPNWEAGGLMRVLLDRDGPLYHAIYDQRTSCERINSQSQALGIERPRVRNGCSVANLNTLTYIIINVRALQRAKSINNGLLQMN